MEVDEPGFRSVLQNVLNRWTALKMVVEHSMGGQHSLEKAQYLVDYLNQVFISNQSVEAEGIEDLLIEYMDTECNTVLEDDSPIEISRTLVRLFGIFSSGGLSAVDAEMQTLPPVVDWLSVSSPPVKRTQVVEDSSDESEQEDGGGEDAMEEGEEQWTKVSYGKKR